MSLHLKVKSRAIILDKTSKEGIFTVDPYELSLLWFIVQNKPISLYDLQHCKFKFPMNRGSLTIPIGNMDAYLAKAEESKEYSYHYPFIQKVIRRLEKKGLVTTIMDRSGPRNRRVVSPSFKGIVYFLQNEPPTRRQVGKMIDNYRVVMLFLFKFLGSFTSNHMDINQWHNAFLETIWEFYGLTRVKFSIKHLNMTFEGYWEALKRFSEKRLVYMDANFQKNPIVLEYLGKNEALEFRNAYIAYLAMNDIDILRFAERQNLEEFSPILISERELAHFEKRKSGGSNFLFNGERPKEFFPKYSDLESFFVGMFVRNLLWIEKRDDQSSKDNVRKLHDYEVEYLD